MAASLWTCLIPILAVQMVLWPANTLAKPPADKCCKLMKLEESDFTDKIKAGPGKFEWMKDVTLPKMPECKNGCVFMNLLTDEFVCVGGPDGIPFNENRCLEESTEHAEKEAEKQILGMLMDMLSGLNKNHAFDKIGE